MANPDPIRTEQEYQVALARIRELFHAEEDTPEGDELEMLVDLVQVYAAEHYPIDPPSPSVAMEYHMDQTGKAPTDLASLTKEHDKVS